MPRKLWEPFQRSSNTPGGVESVPNRNRDHNLTEDPGGSKKNWKISRHYPACRTRGTYGDNSQGRLHPRKESQLLLTSSSFPQENPPRGIFLATLPLLHSHTGILSEALFRGCHSLSICLETLNVSEPTFPSKGKVNMRVFSLPTSQDGCDKLFYMKGLWKEHNAMEISGGFITC